MYDKDKLRKMWDTTRHLASGQKPKAGDLVTGNQNASIASIGICKGDCEDPIKAKVYWLSHNQETEEYYTSLIVLDEKYSVEAKNEKG